MQSVEQCQLTGRAPELADPSGVCGCGGGGAILLHVMGYPICTRETRLCCYPEYSHRLLEIDTPSRMAPHAWGRQSFELQRHPLLEMSHIPDDMEICGTCASSRLPRCRACLPEQLPCRRTDRLQLLCDRRLRRPHALEPVRRGRGEGFPICAIRYRRVGLQEAHLRGSLPLPAYRRPLSTFHVYLMLRLCSHAGRW